VSRLTSGGRIDRSQPLRFTFNGKPFTGYAGDTLASALLANDVRMVAASVTYGRPRGIFSAGVEEPNALVQIGADPMLRATQVELVEGLDAVGLNGKGRLSVEPDSGRFDKLYAHSDVLVVGGGKRLRAAFAYWGWRAAGGSASKTTSLLRAAAAIELAGKRLDRSLRELKELLAT